MNFVSNHDPIPGTPPPTTPMRLPRAVAVITAAGLCLTLLLLTNSTSNLSRPSQLLEAGDDPSPAATGIIRTGAAEDVSEHVVFAVVGSRKPRRRRPFLDLWWRPNYTRGLLWLDVNASTSPPATGSLPSRAFDPSVPVPLQLGRIVLDTFDADDGGPEPWWIVVGDDDTVFFPDNLAAVLGRYDHRRYWYVGGDSESAPQSAKYAGMAFGGGGYAISSGLVKALRTVLVTGKGGCLDRYWQARILDQIMYSCIADLGVAITREPGFHQLDLRGDISGFLSAHPQAPLVSLHHVDLVDPIFPSASATSSSRVEALSRLMTAAAADPSRLLQQSFCYDRPRNRTYSIAFGYSVHAYGPAQGLLPPRLLQIPLRTFRPWKPWGRPGFTFDVRPLPANDSCDGPAVFYLDNVQAAHSESVWGHDFIVTTFAKHSATASGSTGGLTALPAQCDGDGDSSAAAAGIEQIRIVSPMKRLEWPGSRRDCCDVMDSTAPRMNEITLRLRSCLETEALYSP